MKRKVILLTGFNNWGKTYLLTHGLDCRTFKKGTPVEFQGVNYGVIPQSNDDLGRKNYVLRYKERIAALEAKGAKTDFIISAFCPTLEIGNNSLDIIDEIYSDAVIFMIPVVYKWCKQAKLDLEQMQKTYGGRVKMFPITGRESPARIDQFRYILTIINLTAHKYE